MGGVDLLEVQLSENYEAKSAAGWGTGGQGCLLLNRGVNLSEVDLSGERYITLLVFWSFISMLLTFCYQFCFT